MAKTQKAAEAEQGRRYAPLQYEVKIHSLYPEGSCKALASINLNGSFAVRGLKVMEGSNGLFVSMPSYKTGNGEYKNVCFPCSKEARNQLSKAVLDAYQQIIFQNQSQGSQMEESERVDPQMSM